MLLVRLIARLSGLLGRVATLQVIVLMMAMVYEVVCRFVFNAPNLWAFDVATMLAGTLFFLGAAYTLREKGHVRIDFLAQHFPRRLEIAIQTLFALVFLPILGVMLYATAGKAWSAYLDGQTDYTSPWAPLMWPFYATIALGLLGLGLQVLADLVARLLHGPGGTRRFDEAAPDEAAVRATQPSGSAT